MVWWLQLSLAAGGCSAATAAETIRSGRADSIPPILSATILKRMSVEQLLDQEVVSISRKPEPLGQAAGNIFLIRGESVRGTGANSLPQLLRLAPNLFVAQATASDWAIGARGFVPTNSRVNKLLVTIDGRTVYSPLFSGVFWDTQDTFLPDLQNIEVISGPAGSTWGANAVNGIINIRTKSAADTLGGLVYGGLTSPTGGSAGVRYGSQLGDRAAVRVYAKHTDFAATLNAAGEEDDFDAWHTTQFGFRLDGETARATHVTVQGDAYVAHYDRSGDPRARNEGNNLLARWSREFADESAYNVQMYYDYTLREVPGSLLDRLRIVDFEIQHRRWMADRHELVLGFNQRWIQDHISILDGSFAILPERENLQLTGIYAQDDVHFLKSKLRLTSGLRLEHNDYTGWEVQPSVKLAWLPSDHQVWWASASRTTRTPSRVDTDFFSPSAPPFLIAGGPDFDSEILYAYEAGWRSQPIPGMSVTLVGFYHDYRHLRSVEDLTPIVVANRVKGESYGLEYFCDWNVTPAWRIRMGGFVQRQHTSIVPGGTDLMAGLGEASFPEYQAQIRQGYAFNENFSVWAGLRHVGPVPAYSNGVSAGTVPAYTALDANIRWMFQPGMELSLSGRNLLDPSHAEIGTATDRREVERSFHVLMRWEF